MMAAIGTFETYRQTPRMSVYRGRPEVTGGQNDAIDPIATATSTVPWRETLEGLRFECSGIQIGDPSNRTSSFPRACKLTNTLDASAKKTNKSA